MMTMIRPVIARFPNNVNVLEDTNVPFSCVLQPLVGNTRRAASTTSTSTSTSSNAASPVPVPPPPLSSIIPKCQHCGAPHTRTGITHTVTPAPTGLPHPTQCHLCLGEGMMTRRGTSGGVDGNVLLSAPTTAAGDAGRHVFCHEDVFPLPLRSIGGGMAGTSSSSNAAAGIMMSMPAHSCPVLWIVVLDDSCTSSLYWSAVSTALSRIVTEATTTTTFSSSVDHVRVAIVTTSCTVGMENDDDDTADPYYYDSGRRRSTRTTNDRDRKKTRRSFRSRRRTWGVWQLSSPTPAIVHHSIREGINDNDDDVAAQDVYEHCMMTLRQSIVDHMVSLTSPHLPAAIRSMVDYRPPEGEEEDEVEDTDCRTITGPDVESTVNAVLDAVAEIGHPVGRLPTNIDGISSASSRGHLLLPYAGGKITFLLANSPSSIAMAAASSWRGGGVGRRSTGFSGPDAARYEPPVGGSGGRIAFSQRIGHRFDPQPTASAPASPESTNGEHDVTDFDDWSPDRLQLLYPDLDPDLPLMIVQAGRECSDAAMGVDILCLVELDVGRDEDEMLNGRGTHSNDNGGYSYSDEDDEDPTTSSSTIPDFGLCWYATLSSKSGAPGPVLLAIPPHATSSPSAAAAATHRSNALNRELASRVPWNPNLVFGGELRLRLSPGFEVDDSPIEVSTGVPRQYQLASFLSDRGMFGAASSVLESSNLWRMGVADPFNTYCVDLRVNPSQLDVANYSKTDVRPVVQVCFAYTAVVEDAASPGSYVTVRQMRIQTLPVDPLCESTELLYGSVDSEALAVVLFHKLALASFQDGIREVPGIAEDWLQSTFISVYQSAERHSARSEQELLPGSDKNDLPTFYANERLLHRGGELSEEQVLLAQGHDRLRSVALMTYLIMNCDAFRLDRHQSAPLDLRVAALAQMQGMDPDTLTRCIAPKVQLWSSGKGEVEPILDVVDLRAYSVTSTLDEFSQYDLVLVIDTPYVVAAIDGQYWSHFRARNGTSNGAGQRVTEPRKASLPLVLGPALKHAVADAAASYRTPLYPIYLVDCSPEKETRAAGMLLDVLVEDAASPSTHHANYDAWKADIAATVREYVLQCK